jgi:hypothetical protein
LRATRRSRFLTTLNVALDNGIKPREISEIVTHLAFYSGWANAMSAVAVAGIREFVLRNVMDLRNLPGEDAAKSRAELAGRIGQWKLAPKETEKGLVYDVDGALELLNKNDVVPLVARDGIEPPTPAFSGLRSTS